MKWGSPELLAWLWCLLPLAAILFWMRRRRLRALASMIDAGMIGKLTPEWIQKRSRTRLLLWTAAAALLVLSLARPQWGFHWEEVKRRGLDILVVLDTSRSMLAQDIKPNRIQQAKWGIRDLVKRLRGDRIGLVPFAGTSYLQCPLTIDYAAFLMTLDDVMVGSIPRGGTAITEAIKSAAESFDDSGNADKVIILITDGEDHEGDPLSTVEDLKQKGIRLYAIGVGTLEGDLVPSGDNTAGSAFFKDKSGKAVKSALNEALLGKLALSTGGSYIRAAPGDFGLEKLIEQEWSRLKRDESEARMIKAYEDRAGWFLGLALLILVLEAWLPERRRAAA